LLLATFFSCGRQQVNAQNNTRLG